MAEKRLLVILDLNGTILQRIKTDGIMKELLAKNQDIISIGKIHGKPIVARPDSHAFLAGLLEIADVAVWTSAQAKNALPMVMLAFSGLLSKQYYEEEMPAKLRELYGQFKDHPSICHDAMGAHSLKFLWSQDECDEVPTKASKRGKANYKPDFRKDLYKVWKAHAGVYGPANTLMIDDSPKKLGSLTANLLCVPEFDLTKNPFAFQTDAVMSGLDAYLRRMVEDSPEDVRDYLAANPLLRTN
jgi:hypothetical protein